MELNIRIRIFFQLGPGRIGAVFHCEFTKFSKIIITGVLSGQPRGHTLQRRPSDDHLQHIFQRFAENKHTFTG